MGVFHSRQSEFETTCPQPNFELDLLDCVRRAFRNSGLRDDYQILSPPLGESSFCQTRQLLHRRTNELYLLKTFNTTLLSPCEREFLLKHFNLLAELNHPNLLKVVSIIDENADFLCVIFEDYQGDTLGASLANNGGRFSSAEVCFVLNQIFSVLKYLHSKGLQYNNFDPAELLYNGSVVKIFNLERSLSMQYGSRKTVHRSLSAYAAPELVLYGRQARAGDVWSVGVLTYLMLTGQHPFMADKKTTLLENIALNKPCMPIVHLLVTENECEILSRMLESDPDLRITIERAESTKFMTNQNNAILNHLAKVMKMIKDQIEFQPPPTPLEIVFRVLFIDWLPQPLDWFDDPCKLFGMLDERGVGRVTREDVRGVTHRLNMAPFQEALLKLLDTWSPHSQFIIRTVFLAAFLKPLTHSIPKNWADFVATLDPHQTGVITRTAVMVTIGRLHPVLQSFLVLPEEDFELDPNDIKSLLFMEG